MIRILYKVLMILCTAIIFLNITANTIYGMVQIKVQKPLLEKIGEADFHLKYYNEQKQQYTYVKCSIVGFYNKSGFNPAYCMNKKLDGAEKESYYVNIENVLKNDQVWRVIKNGFPYKSAKELGLSNEDNAYMVTKMAVYCVLGESKLENFKAEENDKEAIQMLEVLKELVDVGINGKEVQEEDPISIEKIDDLKEEKEYFFQEYKIKSKVNYNNYEILSESEIPEGCYIANNENRPCKEFNKEQNFKIIIPKDKMKHDLQVKIKVSAECESYLVLEGKTTKENTQNYAVTAGMKSFARAETELIHKANKSSIKINKISKDKKIPLNGVTFELYRDGINIGTSTTDESGKCEFKDLYAGSYKLVEKETNEDYILDQTPLEINLDYNDIKEITITNELKPGQIKVVKEDQDNNKIKLEGVKFEVRDKDGNVLEIITTDKNGEAITSQYSTTQYPNLYFKEVQTNEDYVLDEEIKEVKLEANQIKKVVFQNEKIKGKIQIIKTSKDDNKINSKKAGEPLEGVKFEIYDSNNRLIETIKTDKNGLAITSELEKGEYKIKEIETDKNYFLNPDIVKAKIETNAEIVTVKITNESKNPEVDIEKNGSEYANIGGEAQYDISFRNTGNTDLSDFTIRDYIPAEYIDVTKISTGTYNQDTSYDLYYKTNFTENYILLMEDLKSTDNYEINIKDELSKNEYITEIKLDFGTVDMGFSSNENFHITAIVKSNVKSEDSFTNIADVEANYDGFSVYDKSKWKTVGYKLLPKTGF